MGPRSTSDLANPDPMTLTRTLTPTPNLTLTLTPTLTLTLASPNDPNTGAHGPAQHVTL